MCKDQSSPAQYDQIGNVRFYNKPPGPACNTGIEKIHLFIGGKYLGEFSWREEYQCHCLCRGRKVTWHDNGSLRIMIADCL